MSNSTQRLFPGLRSATLSPEMRLTLLLFALSFFISGVPRVYTQTAAHTLFIQAYGAQAMPWAYLAQALCVPLAGWVYIRAERLASLRTLMVGTLSTQVLALLLFRAGIAAEIPLVAGASIVYFEIEFVLSSLLLWGLANQLMTLRQGKRLFGFVSAGEPVAIIVCGLSMPLLLRWLSAADLFLLSAGGALVGIALVLYILPRHRPTEEDDTGSSSHASTPPAVAWWKNNYVLTMVMLVSVGQLAYFFVDSAFYIEADRRYKSEQEMASFLGLYSAVMGAISLVCSVLLAPWLLRRFGVRAGLLALPCLLLLGSLATVGVAALGGAADLLFWLVVGNKVIDQAFRYTLDKTTFVTLFQPLPAGQRMRVQAGLESVVEPITGGVAGLLLFGMLNVLGFGSVGITSVILAVTCVWVGLVAVQYRGYLGSLRTALAGRGLAPSRLSLNDDASRALLRQGLTSNRPAEVLYCLSLLDSQGLSITDEEATRLLTHPAREVRQDIAQRIERGALRLPEPFLAAAVAAESDPDARGMLLEAWAAISADPVTSLAPWLETPEEPARLGACTGLLRHGGVEGVMAVAPGLLEDLRSADPARRIGAARIMGRAGSAQFYRPLVTLLGDDDDDVARAATRAAARIAVPALLAPLLGAMVRVPLQRTAIAALASFGTSVLGPLEVWRHQANAPLSNQLAAIAVLERIPGELANERLLLLILGDPGPLRQRALRASWRRRMGPTPEHADALNAGLLTEVETAMEALGYWSALHKLQDEATRMMCRVLADQVSRCIDNIFALLALRLPGVDMHEARANYLGGNQVRRSYVIEMLDNALVPALKRRLLPLLEAKDMPQRAERLLVKGVRLESGEVLLKLSADTDADPLVRAVANYALGRDATAQYKQNKGNPMLTIEKLLVLRGVSLFEAVREEYLASAAASATEQRLQAGQTLFEAGDPGSALYVIAAGRLEAQVRGRRIAEMGEREVVGELAVLDPEPRSATVVALTDCVLLRITAADLELLMAEDAELARGIIQALCRRLRQRSSGST